LCRSLAFEASDPILEAAGISVRLVSLTARPRVQRRGPRASIVALVVPGGFIRELPDVTSRRRMATAVPIGTFEVSMPQST
jgi:hypothetical protein